jgi:predicted TIM-barrel fold metal-dependent hydrolase
MARGRARRRAGGARRNVAVKATGQPGYAEDAYPFRSFHEHLHRCFDAFGADRMFWAPTSRECPVPSGSA